MASVAQNEFSRQAWRQAVSDIAEKARAALPEAGGRVDAAVKIILAGDVELLPDGKAKVGSQSNGTTLYHVVNGACSCKDFPHAPSGFCKHRLAMAITKRATPLVQHEEAANDNSPVPSRFFTTVHGKKYILFAGLLARAHAEGLQSLTAEFVSVTDTLAIARATATFRDGRSFSESADATPSNVNATIRPHFPRAALTRAKARTLRDALNIAVVAFEELGE